MHLTLDKIDTIEHTLAGLNERALFRCGIAKQLEERGEYEAAQEALGWLWQGVGVRPALEKLNEAVKPVVLLRVGALSGFLGSARQIANASEESKNLLSESIRLSESLADTMAAAEGRYEIGYCYFRDGAFDEARLFFREALETLGGAETSTSNVASDELKAHILVRSSMVEYRANRPEEALRFLTAAAPFVEQSENDMLRGKYHVERATTLKNLGVMTGQQHHFDEALIAYAAASFYFEQAGHQRYRARVENNCGMLYVQIGRFSEAHEHLDHALSIFAGLNDPGSAAQVLESRARAFLGSKQNAKAEEAARKSAEVLEGGAEGAYLAEALTTQGIALARLGKTEESRHALERAVEVAELAGDIEGAGRAELAISEELTESLSPGEMCAIYVRADQLLSKSHHAESLARLRKCALKIIARDTHSQERALEDKQSADVMVEWHGCSLPEEVHRLEAELIGRALRMTNNSVTRAAHLLGLSHQTLSVMLKTRHLGLHAPAKPRKRRQQSIIGKKSAARARNRS